MNGSDRMGMDKRKYFLLKTVIFLFMLAAALIALFPFYWMEQFCNCFIQSTVWAVFQKQLYCNNSFNIDHCMH